MAKLNVQGLARRSPELMKALQPRKGLILVSQDLQAAEPSITAHFSGDKNYRYAVYDGIGKPPYYSPDGTLMIDDIYLMTMSRSPIGKTEMRALFDQTFDGRTFSEQWVINKDVPLSRIKDLRGTIKGWALGLSYGMGWKSLVSHAYDKGYVLSAKDAKEFYQTYWSIYSGVKDFSDRLSRIVKKTGYLVNPFGYRCVPEPHKAFNAFIQSSVSGLINVLFMKLLTISPYARLITIIHDEGIFEIPETKVEQFKADLAAALQSLNDDLGWSIKIRTGFVTGRDLYEAK